MERCAGCGGGQKQAYGVRILAELVYLFIAQLVQLTGKAVACLLMPDMPRLDRSESHMCAIRRPGLDRVLHQTDPAGTGVSPEVGLPGQS